MFKPIIFGSFLIAAVLAFDVQDLNRLEYNAPPHRGLSLPYPYQESRDKRVVEPYYYDTVLVPAPVAPKAVGVFKLGLVATVASMYKIITIILALVVAAWTAELSSSYALLEKNAAFQPDLKTEPIETHAVFKKENSLEPEKHPVYRVEDGVRINPVRPDMSSHMKHDMLSDQPAAPPSTDVNRLDNQAEPHYGFITRPVEVTYPDVPYAPGYGYDNGYSASNYYDMYGNPNNYMMEPDTSAFGLLWSQVPDARTMVSYAGRTISWVFSSIFVILLGSFLTIGVCSYTNLCSITFHGVGPIHEEMRSLMSPERLEKISNAADFVKNAINKYQKIQQVTEANGNRKRRAILY